MERGRGGSWLVLFFAFVARCPAGESGDLIARLPFRALAPQDITWDGSIYYVTTFLDAKVYRYREDLKTSLEPLTPPINASLGLTGIAFNQDPENPRLWIAEPIAREIREFYLDGEPTGRDLYPDFHPVVNAGTDPLPRGMAFDRTGNFGNGSLYVAESVGSLIYEIALDGKILRAMSHPDDPDGYPGKGATAPFTDVELTHDAQGALTGFFVTGGRGRTDYLRRLDREGEYGGFSIPLDCAGGTISGFIFKQFALPGEPPVDAVITLVDSAAKFAVLDPVLPPVGEIFDLRCSAEKRAAVLSWQNGSSYDRIELYRDCELVAVLGGNEVSAGEDGVGPGLHAYRLQATLGERTFSSGECKVVIEGGSVLRQAPYPGRLPVDLAVDPSGFIYVSDYEENRIYVFDDGFRFQAALDLPFLTPDDHITGLAYGPEGGGRLYVYNSEKNIIVETDTSGLPLRGISIHLPNDPQNPNDKAIVGGMTLDPDAGTDPPGALWFIEIRRATIYAFDLEGNLIKKFLHPVALQNPVPPNAPIFNNLGGLSEAPANGFEFLDLTSGTVFERDVKRIIRVRTIDGTEVPGYELTLAGQDLAVGANFVGIQHAVRKDGTPTLYATAAAGNASLLLELDPTLPLPRPLSRLSARQRGRTREVELVFNANDDYERILIERDCSPVAELQAGQFARGTVSYVETGVAPGSHRYGLRGAKGGVETSVITAEVTVGPCAILDRVFSHPVFSPLQLTRDPEDGSFLLSSNSPDQERSIYRYRPDLTFANVLEDVIPAPWEIAALAVRVGGVEGKCIYLIAWTMPGGVGGQQTFPLYVLSPTGQIKRQLSIKPPRPTNGFVTYPTGLAWDRRDDVFYYLERNSSTIVRMDTQGNTLALIPHPAPPQQSFVFNLGLSIDAENGALYLTGAGPKDRRITKALQLTTEGRLTGLEFNFGSPSLSPLHGIAADGYDLIVAGHDAAGALERLQLFQTLPPPIDLTCNARGREILLTWVSPVGYERTMVLRNGVQVAALAGAATSYLDRPPGRESSLVYSVAGRTPAGDLGKNAFCEVPPLPAGFIRGDVDQNGALNITDPILLLDYLFLAGTRPPCDDAADADDSGDISITDPIRILGLLFLGDAPLPAPYPDPGEDATPDSLSCS